MRRRRWRWLATVSLALALALAEAGCQEEPPPGGDPGEQCDGLDNDGDGAVDEGFDCVMDDVEDCAHDATGCDGERVCQPNCRWSECTLPDEACNPDSTRPCTAHGSCQGVETCLADCAWSACENPAWECEPSQNESCKYGSCPGSRSCTPECHWDDCAPACGGDLTCCNDGCVDTASDWHHCGTCERICEIEDGCYGGACCIESVRNGSEVCDDQHFTVPAPYVPMYFVCRNDNGGVGYVSDGTGPPCEDGIPRCQGWEQQGQNAWDHLHYLFQTTCTQEGWMIEVDLSTWSGSGMYVGSHDQPTGGGHMTEVCIAEGL